MTPRAFFLWDNTAYALGVSAQTGKDADLRFATFKTYHLDKLQDAEDPGLVALRLFLQSWGPEAFIAPLWPDEMKDQNVVFQLESEHRVRFLHQRPAARPLWDRLNAEAGSSLAICLVTGERAPVARLHPAIKGVRGAQSSGASP